MAFYKKFTPKKDPKISFGQDKDRRFSSNRSDNSARTSSTEDSRDNYRSNQAKPGAFNQGKGERSSFSKPFQTRSYRGSNENAQQSSDKRYNDKKGFSPSDNRDSYGRPSENKNYAPSQNRGQYGRPSDNRSNSSNEYRSSFGKPAEDKRSAPGQNKGTYGRPAKGRNSSSNEFHGSFSKPTDNRRSAPSQNRSSYSRPLESRYSPFKDSAGSFGKSAEDRRPAPGQNKGPYGRPAEGHNVIPVQNENNQNYQQDQHDLPSTVYELPENLLSGRNPIREALKVGRDIEKLMVASGELSGSAREIIAMAKNAGVIVQTVERTRLDQITRNHQGMVAFASAFPYSNLEEILEVAKQKDESPFIVILDKITDPMNLGAIIRSAACAGAHGVIVQQHRAVGLTPSAVRASAGAVEHVKVARVTNINQTIRDLRKMGIWIYASDSKGEDYRKVDFSGACALVIGSEGEGVSQLTLELSDKTVSIPMSGVIDSLNASVAAGILMFAVYTGRDKTLLR